MNVTVLIEEVSYPGIYQLFSLNRRPGPLGHRPWTVKERTDYFMMSDLRLFSYDSD